MLRAEFTVEPWASGDRGLHGRAALEVVASSNLDSEDGPFGTRIDGNDDQVIETMEEVIRRSMAAGASRISFQVSRL